MNANPQIDDLLDTWQAARDAGLDTSAAELCRDCPTLIPEMEQRLSVLRIGAALVAPSVTDGVTGEWGAAPRTEPLPTKLGAFRVIALLGAGGMGDVYRAHDAELNREVALKVMKPELAARSDARERFLREARAAAAVRHDHVVAIYHVGEHAGTPFLVMPLLEGESLEARVERVGTLTTEEVARIGRQAAEGLAAAHAKGLIHRDIKPANLWLEKPTGRVLILDFGLARAADGSDGVTRPGAVAGTPAYMSPEQIDGLELDHRTDLFALGATLYRCATGRRAFEGKTTTAVMRAVAEHMPPPPHEVNPAIPLVVSSLIMRLLAKNPADRPANAQAVADELATLAPGSSVNEPSVTKTFTPESPTPPERPRWKPLAALAVAFAVLIGVGVVMKNRNRNTEVADNPKGTEPSPEKQPDPKQQQPDPKQPQTTPTVTYKGKVDVKLARTKDDPLQRLNVFGALPMRENDSFRIEVEVDPPAYVYVVWVDPAKSGKPELTPVYPWNPAVEPAEAAWKTRPAKEEPIAKLNLPRDTGVRWTAPGAKPGVATLVMFARPTPLDVPDEEVRKWFESLPELPLPPGGESGAVWFDNYVEVRESDRSRTFGTVASGDPFARWQSQLQKSLGNNAKFQTAVSFARSSKK